MSDPLPERFGRLWRRLGAAGDGEPVFAALAAAYAEPHRVYHTGDHLGDCLAELDAAPDAGQDRDAVEAALWFHDAVFDSAAADNESRSADWAGRALGGAGVAPPTVAEVTRLVLLTRHMEPAIDPAGALICDIDLSILGRNPADFADYERGIRAEYASVPEPLYRAGRGRILSAFLARRPLFQTEHFRWRYEESARRNLSAALARLSPPPA